MKSGPCTNSPGAFNFGCSVRKRLDVQLQLEDSDVHSTATCQQAIMANGELPVTMKRKRGDEEASDGSEAELKKAKRGGRNKKQQYRRSGPQGSTRKAAEVDSKVTERGRQPVLLSI